MSSSLASGNLLAMTARGSEAFASESLAAGSAASAEPTTIAAANTPASALRENFFMTAFRLGAARPPDSFDAAALKRFRSVAELCQGPGNPHSASAARMVLRVQLFHALASDVR